MQSLGEVAKFIKGLAPAADRWNTNPATDVVSMRDAEKCLFLVHQQGGTTGNATLTVQACSDVTPSATTAIAFRYRVGGTDDSMGAWTEATVSGFTTTANSDRLYLVEVDANNVYATGYTFVRMLCTEATNDPVNGAVEILLFGLRYQGATIPTAIA